jgi:hypothetical protein
LDLEATEFYIRSAVLGLGAGVLERLLHDVGVGRQARPRMCANHHLPCRMKSSGVREKSLQTILGPVRFARSRYVCPECGAVEYPADALLGVSGTGFSPGVRRLMTRAGCRGESFAGAAEDLDVYAALPLDAKDVERVSENVGRMIDDWMRSQGAAALMGANPDAQREDPIPILYVSLDGTGVPMRKSELAQVRGKAKDGQAKTREVKLGCIFTQTTTDDAGNPLRDEASTSYVGAIESSSDFGHRLHQEALRRGLRQARQVVVLSDGAEYNTAIAQEHFPAAPHILDFYHAAERLSELVKDDTSHSVNGQFHRQCCDLLQAGQIELMLESLREALPKTGKRRKAGLKHIAYFHQRKEQMRYAKFRAKGFFIGSGVIEAGCKTLIGKRLKQSGMFWSAAGANAIIAARCCLYSGRFEQFWEDTAA